MIYLYAITRAGPPLPSGPGLEDAPLVVVEEGPLAAVGSEHRDSIAGGEQALWRHEEVVEGLMAHTTVLPMRFGAVVGDTGEVSALLARERERYETLLADLRGRVELGVRVMPVTEPASPAKTETSGRAYMMGRLERAQEAADALRAVHTALEPLAVTSHLRERAVGKLSSSGAYLVEGDAVDAFSAEVDALAAAHPELAVLFTGPWPPYSFVGDLREERPRVDAA